MVGKYRPRRSHDITDYYSIKVLVLDGPPRPPLPTDTIPPRPPPPETDDEDDMHFPIPQDNQPIMVCIDDHMYLPVNNIITECLKS